MRKLQTRDVFAFLRVASQANIRREIRLIADRLAGDEQISATDVGYELILTCIEHLGEKKAEGLVYELLAGPLEMETAAIETMELGQLAKTLREWADGYLDKEELQAFFRSASALMK